MRFIRQSQLAGVAATVFLVATCAALFAQATKEDEELRQRALALNDVTGDDPIKGEIQALSKNSAETKKLLAVAVKMAKEKEQPFNYNGALILASAAFRLDELDASEALYLVCAQQAGALKSPHKMQQAAAGLTFVAQQLYDKKKYDKSAKLSQQFLEILEKWGAKPEFKEKVFRHMIQAMFKEGKTTKANEMVDNLLKQQPNNWRNIRLRAWVEKERGNVDNAGKLYKDVLDRITQDRELKADEKEDEQSHVYGSILDIAQELDQAKKYDKSLKLSQDLLDAMERQGAEKRKRDIVLRQRIQTMYRSGDKEQALKLADKLVKQSADDWRNLSLKAALANENGRFEEAAKIYEGILQKVTEDAHLDPDERVEEQKAIRHMLSAVYVELDQVEKAAAQLKTLLSQYPDNPTYNNDLGYIWADHDQNLDEAERMIKKALDEDRKQRKEEKNLKAHDDKDNPAYLDSMGWVLFKKKKYDEAKKYLIQASQDKDGQHIEILDHLGDTYLKLGEKPEAVKIWKKAAEIKPASKREEQKKAQVEQKLKANQ
jgi:tetratricopeptide (TPR) repeat protein